VAEEPVFENADLSPLSGAQIEIMNLVWELGETTVSEVWKSLQKKRPVARTTVLTVIDRLEKKGWLRRRVADQQHFFSAARTRQETLGGIVERLVQTAFAGSAEELVVALLDGRGVSDAEAKRIRTLIEKARRKQS
jgi:predicted transcriptional regulator